MMIMKIKDCNFDETETYRVTDEEAKVIEKFIKLDSIEYALENENIKVLIEVSTNIKDF